MRQRTDSSVLQSLSRPVADYRQSVQDLHSAVDRVLSMYAEINQAHTSLSQSFANDGSGNWQENIKASADQALELNAVSGVLSDLKAGLSKANTRLLQATGRSSDSVSSGSSQLTLSTMMSQHQQQQQQEQQQEQQQQQLGSSWSSLSAPSSERNGSVEVPAILEQYSDMLVNLVQSKIAASQQKKE